MAYTGFGKEFLGILLDYHYRKSHQSTGPSTVECQARGFAMHEFGVMM